jgi:hypothetical protein
MKMLDFFRKRKGKVLAEPLRMNFSEVGDWIEGEILKSKKREDYVLGGLKERISDFVLDIEEKIIVLRNFDLASRKEDKRIKNAVLDSRNLYIESLGNLVRDLGKVDEVRVKVFVDEVNRIILDFDKKSFKNYGRANYLIGNELVDIKKSLKSFSSDVLKIFEDNKGDVDLFSSLLDVKGRIEDVFSIDFVLRDVDRVKTEFGEKIRKNEREKLNLMSALENIKSSADYLENLERRRQIEFLVRDLDKRILDLKRLIDFKGLANFFHSDSSKMRVIGEYRDHFMDNFIIDFGGNLLKLLSDAKMDREVVWDKIKKIRGDFEKISEMRNDLGVDESLGFSLRIEGIEGEIENLKRGEFEEGKKEDKLRANRLELIKLLKMDLVSLGVELS